MFGQTTPPGKPQLRLAGVLVQAFVFENFRENHKGLLKMSPGFVFVVLYGCYLCAQVAIKRRDAAQVNDRLFDCPVFQLEYTSLQSLLIGTDPIADLQHYHQEPQSTHILPSNPISSNATRLTVQLRNRGFHDVHHQGDSLHNMRLRERLHP